MKYQIEYCPNPDCVQIHTDQRLIQGTILCFEHFETSNYNKKEFKEQAVNEEGLINFCKVVSELDGMEQDISFSRYQIQMSKASVFSWDALLPHILDALRTFVARDAQIEESAAPKRPTASYLKALRRQGCAV